MNIISKLAVVLILIITTAIMNAQETYSLTVKIEGAANDEGKMMIALYDSESNFLEKTFKGSTSQISNKGCTVTFENVPEGIYAVSIFHDENDNDKLDSNFIGIPKEDYGCSNGASGFMGPPKWKDAKFELKADKSITITL